MNLPQAADAPAVNITRMGIIASMTFFGIIYPWIVVDTLWPCCVGIAALIFRGFTPPLKALPLFLINPMIVISLFPFILVCIICTVLKMTSTTVASPFSVTRYGIGMNKQQRYRHP